MQRKWGMLAVSAVLATMLAGCGARQGDLGNSNIREQSVRYDMNGNRIMNKRFANDQMNEMNRMDGRRLNSNNIVGYHKNYRLEMSGDIADRIAAMKEVDKAYVMLTDNNAYVAVTLNHDKKDKNGVTGKSSDGRTKSLGRTTQSYMRPMDAATPNGDRSSLMRAKSEADNNASAQIKDRIGSEVKSMAPQIEHVYVSANPDFVNRMTSYMDDVKLGHPIQGFVAEFNAMVERVFPARAK